MMHGSNSRPRQRTFTSCVECRRRKQRCNQRKDAPCNNCSRRYPPVLCTYQSTSPPPSFDRIVDLRDDDSLALRQDYHQHQHHSADRSTSGLGPSYTQSTAADMSGYPATSMSDHSYYDSSRTYYSTPSSRADYKSYTSDSLSSAQHNVPSNMMYAPAPLDQGYYHGGQMSYSSPSSITATTHGGYYSASTTQGGDWLSSNGDPGAFVGAVGSADYYYVCDPDLNGSGPLSPRR